MSNEVNYDNFQVLYEMRRNQVSELEKKFSELKMQAKAEIDGLRNKLLITESESQRTIMEYQRQCGNEF